MPHCGHIKVCNAVSLFDCNIVGSAEHLGSLTVVFGIWLVRDKFLLPNQYQRVKIVIISNLTR